MRIGLSLSSTHTVDHHVQHDYYQNTPTLGRLLAEWNDKPAGCLFLGPLWHPVIMAEHIGTLASIHSGPFIVQTGLGRGERQFAAMGVDVRYRPSLFEETVRVVRALPAGETVSSERLGLADARIGVLPPSPSSGGSGRGPNRLSTAPPASATATTAGRATRNGRKLF
ncbi:MAG: LLM class flavin-dependent oxidoreductase [Actinomycetia bacterium]|nr:LLM class flavin-dependent oxidoreductase [Actinomycetes bacterium]MCP4085189.1 LLM class flavin-dependent oxidoreductase [Actinomycetes bacterium]